MVIIIELAFQLFAEVILQILAEALFELGFHGLSESINKKRRRNPFLASCGYFVWGGVIGGVTLFFFPELMITDPALRKLNLILSPVIAGLSMSAIGSLRKRKGQTLLRIDSFLYGALFALGLGLVRYLYETYFR